MREKVTEFQVENASWYKEVKAAGVSGAIGQCDIMTSEHHPLLLLCYKIKSIDDHNVMVAPNRLAVYS